MFRPGLDRIALIDDDCDLSELTPDNLRNIRAHFRALEALPASSGEAANRPALKSALVCKETLKTFVAKLYAAIGQSEQDPGFHVETFLHRDEALRWLGRPGLELPPFPHRAL